MTLQELAQAVQRHADRQGFGDLPTPTGIDRLNLARTRQPSEFSAVDYRPIFCLVLQGAKQAFIGDTVVTFSERQSLIVSLDLPTTGRVLSATPLKPYLALALELDTALLREICADHPDALPAPLTDRAAAQTGALCVGEADEALIDAMGRLFSLVEQPAEAGFLAPLITREIHYRLLRSSQSAHLQHICQPDSHAGRISRAIGRLRQDYLKPLPVADLAREAGMSSSAFHDHFRSLTGTTPLQYQKSLRLMEARRRLQGGGESIASIAFAVGYESPAQFSREYARKFGLPPRTDRRLTA